MLSLEFEFVLFNDFVSERKFGIMYDHTFSLLADVRSEANRAVNLMIANGHSNLPL